MNSRRAARRTRTKTRKPKFLSLRHQLSPRNSNSSSSPSIDDNHNPHNHAQKQLNLFPLHPENLIQDNDANDDNVSFLLNADGGATLNGLLAPSAATGNPTSNSTSSAEDDLSFAYRAEEETCGDSDGGYLVRTAMRNRERDASEEKWVCYSEVVERKASPGVEEVTSCAADGRGKKGIKKGLLSLKLDYEEILNAWSDQSPLYIKGEGPQTVPDLDEDDDDQLLHDHDLLPNGEVDGWSWRRAGELWRVPEMGGGRNGSSMKMEDQGGTVKSTAKREASLLRYKEKRQSRLFSKRVRYEVRRLNAEKRPRFKGRFVKRN